MDEHSTTLFPVDEAGNCGIAESRDEIIDRYLLEQMSEAQSEAFLEHLLFCPACNRDLRFREQVIDSLQQEKVAEPYGARAAAVRARRASAGGGNRPPNDQPARFRWLAAAAAALLLLSLGVFYTMLSTEPTPREALALLDDSEFKPYYLQDANDVRWRDYNRGLALLFQTQQRQWWHSGYVVNREKLVAAIDLLETSFSQSLPEDVRMDIAFYLFKAWLMMDDTAKALSWLEATGTLAANRVKITRALELSHRLETVLRSEVQQAPSAESEALLVRTRHLQATLSALIDR